MHEELPFPLLFGIPSLDDLLGTERVDMSRPTSLCILGPDGAGKSILAMHLASHYLVAARGARVIYASTDLSHDKARRSWEKFGLHVPLLRLMNPFSPRTSPSDLGDTLEMATVDALQEPEASRPSETEALTRRTLEIQLANVDPGDLSLELIRSPARPLAQERAIFLNLASKTSGDDWGFLNRTLASLSSEDRPHMLVIDAVEGLETLVGDRDAFGQERSRRSRIAQIMRTASAKAHVVFILEQTSESTRQPEEFVADFVVRLRSELQRGYNRRTIEIVKARGLNHVRGQHAYLIRDGEGSRTGPDADNPDDPQVSYEHDGRVHVQSYVHVCPSIHRLTRRSMERGTSPRAEIEVESGVVAKSLAVPPPERAAGSATLDRAADRRQSSAFSGVRYLDEIVPGDCAGRVHALIGDHGTHKSRLGWAFLSQCFPDDETAPDGVAVLLTTRNLSASDLRVHFEADLTRQRAVATDRIFCRKLEVHDIPAPILAHIAAQLLRAALDTVGENGADRVRFVIDDWSTIRSTYHGVAKDDLILPHLVGLLEDAGVTGLIVSTQPGRPGLPVREAGDRALRSLVDQHLLTWDLNFFGERRVAIMAVPGQEHQSQIRELRVEERDSTRGDGTRHRRIKVEPHFEVYSGLEHGTPELTPLDIHLYAATDRFASYCAKVNDYLKHAFVGLPEDRVVTVEPAEGYESLQSLCTLQRATRLASARVLQIHEFWGTQNESTLLDLRRDYWESEIRDAEDDPFHSFDGTEGMPSTSRDRRRKDFFSLPMQYSEPSVVDGEDSARYSYPDEWRDRVPFMWDFGFLLLRRNAWQDAFEISLRETQSTPGGDVRVRNVWEQLVGPGDGHPTWSGVRWSEFFEACEIVARTRRLRGGDEITWPFDIDMLTPETFSCLVLEIWASEICISLGESERKRFQEALATFSREIPRLSLVDLLRRFRNELYLTWMLLCEALQGVPLTSDGSLGFEFARRSVNLKAVASRHWYATASRAMAEAEASAPLKIARLPGEFSVRGDWFLGIAKGSRSSRLAMQAIDLLTSVPANSARLRWGFGLPCRPLLGREGSGRPRDLAQTMRLPTALHRAELGGPRRLDEPSFVDDGDLGRQRPVYLHEFLRIAPRETFAGVGTDRFRWLWRSRLDHYEGHSRVWQRWLCRTHGWLDQIRQERGPDWTPGFRVYRELRAELPTVPSRVRHLESYARFEASVNVLIQELEALTPVSDAYRMQGEDR